MSLDNATKELNAFLKDLQKVTFKKLKPDEYSGIRYSVKVEEGSLKLPHIFTRLGKLDTKDLYMYLLPETPEDPEFALLAKAIKALETTVKENVPAKKYAPVIKNVAQPSVNVKLYHDKSKVITSKFMTNEGVTIHVETDSRMDNKSLKKILYADILVDSVYITKDDLTHISFKLSQACVYFYRNESTLDLDLVDSLRKMKIEDQAEE